MGLEEEKEVQKEKEKLEEMEGSRLSENISCSIFDKPGSREAEEEKKEKDKLCSREVEEVKEVEKDKCPTEIEEEKEVEKDESHSREIEEEKRVEKDKPRSEKVKEEKKAEKDMPRSKKAEGKKKLKEREEMEKPFIISRLPNSISEASRDLYKPRMVSIGPHYCNTKEFPDLEEINPNKQRLLESFLSRDSKHDKVAYVEELQKLEPDARKCYPESDSIPANEFVEMLLLDGCFILELFFKWLNKDSDVLFTERYGLAKIVTDLLLFENQIPFIVIEKLFKMVMAEEAEEAEDAFINLLAKFLMNDHAPSRILEIGSKKFYYILDLYHYFLDDDAPVHYLLYNDDCINLYCLVCFFLEVLYYVLCPTCLFQKAGKNDQEVGKNDQELGENDQNPLPLWKKELTRWTPKADWSVKRPLPGAVELHAAGVKFKRNLSFKSLFHVKFDRGVLEIPLLIIDSNKKKLLANLLALEKQETWRHQTVTSYVTLMDSLINTKQDVALLQRAGVIHNKLRDQKEAADFFNQIGENLSIDNANPDFVKLFKVVELYYDSSWNRSRARLMHDHFNSPWAIISVIAGVILLGLTVTQTFFTVYPYYRPSS